MAEDDRIPEDDVMLAETPDEGGRPDDRIDDERMDEENTLKREFVRSVEDALDAGETAQVGLAGHHLPPLVWLRA